MASDRTRTPDEEQARLDNHYGYCTLPPDHDGPCAPGEHNHNRGGMVLVESSRGTVRPSPR